jgi:hypothetical protein
METVHGDITVPAAAGCTLDAAGRLARAAEFDEFFASALTGSRRTDATRLRLELAADEQTGRRAGGLAAAETACCSFFTFTLTASAGQLALEVTVPPAHQGALDLLAARAATARPA